MNDKPLIWTRLLFPTDLTSVLEIIRQHGDVAYTLMFSYAGSHSLLLTLSRAKRRIGRAEPSYRHHGLLARQFTGDVIRFWIGRRFGTRWLGSSSSRITRAVQSRPGWPTAITSG